ncbi:TPA: hypothetical protein L5368_001296, partial [Pseudomonas aeruginosa]|nr:hypothetical protein [Pseudomonas aeruginosa]HBP4443577.1 hypothetical protein [Pseudomonas aeruginosa]
MDISYIVGVLSCNILSRKLVESLRSELATAKLGRKRLKSEVESGVAELLALMGGNNVKAAKLLARALIVFSPEKSLLEMRSVGVFRCSKYKFKTGVVKAVVRDYIENRDALGLDSEQLEYFESVQRLLGLGSRACQINAGLLDVIKSRKKLIIKTLLANLEMIFATRMPGFDKSLSSNGIEHYSNEDLAEAFSYILKMYRDEFGVVNEYFQHVDESANSTDLYWRLLIDAAKICNYKEAEL